MLAADRPVAARLAPVARLLRLQNGAIAAAGVIAGAWWSSGRWTEEVAVVAAAAVALAGFANAANDYRDVEIDRIAHPDRPLPRGELSPGAAVAATVVCGTVALALLAAVSGGMALVTLAVLAGMVVYSTHLKAWGLPGNLTVALLASLPFAYGAWVAGVPRAALPLLAVGVPLHLARELAKDLDDVAGDRLSRATLPLVAGRAATRAAFAAAVTLFVVSLVVVARVATPSLRFAVAALPALVLVALATARVVGGRGGAPALLKQSMIAALLPLFLTRY